MKKTQTHIQFLFFILFSLLYSCTNAQTFAESFKGSSEDDDNGRCIARDVSGNLYVGGQFRTTVDFDPSSGSTANLVTGQVTTDGNYNGFVGKYNSIGEYIWAFKIGNAVSNEQTIVNGITVDGIGSIYITGQFQGTVDFDPGVGVSSLSSAGSNDIFFAKYDNNGNYQWAKRIGAASSDKGLAIDVDAGNNIYITGNFQGTADFDPGAATLNLISVGSLDAFVASYNSSGIYLWAFSIGSSSAENGYRVKIDATSSNVYICGSFQKTVDFDPGAAIFNLTSSTPASGIDIDGFVAKYTIAGTFVWAKKIGGSPATTLTEEVQCMALDASDNVFIAGQFVSGAIDVSGTNLTKKGSIDTFYAKYNSSGVLQWTKNIGTVANNVNPNDLYVEGTKLFLVGSFTNTIDFDPNAGVENGISNGSTDMYFSEYNISDGSFVCKATIGGTSIDYAYGVVGDGSNAGSFYVIGWFRGVNIDFNPGIGTTSLSSGTGGTMSDVFLGHYGLSAEGLGCIIVLPVELLDFDAKCSNGEIVINWTTLSEINNDYFTLERSVNSIDWELVGFVNGAGNSNSRLDYSFTDNNIGQQAINYRLKQTDYDGKNEMLMIVSAQCNSENSIRINLKPNPAINELNIMVYSEKNVPKQIFLTNVLGERVVETESVVNNEIKINIEHLAKGIYFVSSSIEDIKPVKFIKQ